MLRELLSKSQQIASESQPSYYIKWPSKLPAYQPNLQLSDTARNAARAITDGNLTYSQFSNASNKYRNEYDSSLYQEGQNAINTIREVREDDSGYEKDIHRLPKQHVIAKLTKSLQAILDPSVGISEGHDIKTRRGREGILSRVDFAKNHKDIIPYLKERGHNIDLSGLSAGGAILRYVHDILSGEVTSADTLKHPLKDQVLNILTGMEENPEHQGKYLHQLAKTITTHVSERKSSDVHGTDNNVKDTEGNSSSSMSNISGGVDPAEQYTIPVNRNGIVGLIKGAIAEHKKGTGPNAALELLQNHIHPSISMPVIMNVLKRNKKEQVAFIDHLVDHAIHEMGTHAINSGLENKDINPKSNELHINGFLNNATFTPNQNGRYESLNDLAHAALRVFPVSIQGHPNFSSMTAHRHQFGQMDNLNGSRIADSPTEDYDRKSIDKAINTYNYVKHKNGEISSKSYEEFRPIIHDAIMSDDAIKNKDAEISQIDHGHHLIGYNLAKYQILGRKSPFVLNHDITNEVIDQAKLMRVGDQTMRQRRSRSPLKVLPEGSTDRDKINNIIDESTIGVDGNNKLFRHLNRVSPDAVEDLVGHMDEDGNVAGSHFRSIIERHLPSEKHEDVYKLIANS